MPIQTIEIDVEVPEGFTVSKVKLGKVTKQGKFWNHHKIKMHVEPVNPTYYEERAFLARTEGNLVVTKLRKGVSTITPEQAEQDLNFVKWLDKDWVKIVKFN